jgi:uncharacterized membrane protein
VSASSEPVLDRETTALDRILWFSDAVFAIAITLLVLDIGVPPPDVTDVGGWLRDRGAEFFSFGLSFAVIGSQWLSHHRLFRHIVRYDEGLLLLNLAVLLCIAFLPYPTAVLGEHGSTLVPVVFYAASMSATGLVLAALWVYASRDRRLVAPDLHRDRARYLVLRAGIAPAMFLPSIPVAFADPRAAQFVWLGMWGVMVAVNRRFSRTHGQARPAGG